MIGLQATVCIPGTGAATAVLNLNEADTAFDQPPCRQQLHAEVAAVGLVDPIQGLGLRRLLRELDHLRHRLLHPERELIRGDAGRHRGIVGILDAPQRIEPADQVLSHRPGFRARTRRSGAE